LPWLFARGSIDIFATLLRQLFGGAPAQSLLQEVAFDVGAEDDPDAVARRALAIGYTTMTPNFVIIGIDRQRRTMLYHQIDRSPVPEMTRRLGARP
jgi:hypothetical protein